MSSALSHELLGVDGSLHLALALVLAVATSLAFYAVLRALGMERPHAGAIAALLLLFPASDSTRLWASAGLNTLSVLLYLLGVLAALRGLGAAGRRAAAWHVGALILYVLAIFAYEAVAGVVAATGFVYAFRSSWRAALRRWPADLLTVAVAVALSAANTTRDVQPVGVQLQHARSIAEESLGVLAAAAVPVGDSPRAAVLAGLTAIALAGAAAARRGVERRRLRRWLATGGAGAGAIAAGYLLLVPAHPHYLPLNPGVTNRMNLVAALGFVLLVYALTMVAALLVARALGRPRLATALALAVTVAVGAGYVDRLRGDEEGWRRSAEVQEEVLGALDRRSGEVPRDGTVYVFGAPVYAAPGVPVFRHLDLEGAAQLTLEDASIDAWPIYPRTRFVCGGALVYPSTNGYRGPAERTPGRFSVDASARYGRALFLDVRSAELRRVDDPAGCRAAVGDFRPGPWYPSG